MRYTQVIDGEWFEPSPQTGHKMRCCDCGLIHRIDFRIHNGKVQLRAVRDKKATNAFRKRAQPVVVIDVRKSPFRPPF